MSNFRLIKGSCVEQKADVVVNAANNGLWQGGGICGVIFDRAGSYELQAACNKYKTPLKDGQAVITDSFKMKEFKKIIHAVGPDFRDKPDAYQELFDAYYNSLICLKDNNYHSISFPLISAGIFGGSDKTKAIQESYKQALRAYNSFIKNYPDYEIEVLLCAYSYNEYCILKDLND